MKRDKLYHTNCKQDSSLIVIINSFNATLYDKFALFPLTYVYVRLLICFRKFMRQNPIPPPASVLTLARN